MHIIILTNIKKKITFIERLDDDEEKNYIKRRAIRELNYGNAAKIFLKFGSRFWEKEKNETEETEETEKTKKTKPVVGSNSTTDLPLRTVIYPSYYKEIDKGEP